MVGHREKRCSNASSRGIKSDRSTIRYTRVTQPVMQVERGRQSRPAHAGRSARSWERHPRRCAERRVWRILAGSEHRRRKALASEVPCFFTVTTHRLTAICRDEPLATMAGGRFPNRRVGRVRRRSQGGTERSSFTHPLRRVGTTGAAANEQGFRSLGCGRTACATHPPQEQSCGRRTLKGNKAQGG